MRRSLNEFEAFTQSVDQRFAHMEVHTLPKMPFDPSLSQSLLGDNDVEQWKQLVQQYCKRLASFNGVFNSVIVRQFFAFDRGSKAETDTPRETTVIDLNQNAYDDYFRMGSSEESKELEWSEYSGTPDKGRVMPLDVLLSRTYVQSPSMRSDLNP